jgi:hypothetical protein
MQNRKWIGPKLHERPQIVSPLSGPQATPQEETKEEVVKEPEAVVEDKKIAPKENKKS